ncbi:hypothetical protein F383_38461 [Gossypium arboreum]|uniref:Uncharacterized protein n=1 Tax=Gossypium arboreum TaxID=29729 RepID=A0A0B0MFE5_GOSAR|nr:hypothetical protein F383_38461 [Gossypium arboreum]
MAIHEICAPVLDMFGTCIGHIMRASVRPCLRHGIGIEMYRCKTCLGHGIDKDG